VADPTVVSLELLTVLVAGPMCFYILKQMANNDPARHYWLIVLSTAEIYGGYVPEYHLIGICTDIAQMDDVLP